MVIETFKGRSSSRNRETVTRQLLTDKMTLTLGQSKIQKSMVFLEVESCFYLVIFMSFLTGG